MNKSCTSAPENALRRTDYGCQVFLLSMSRILRVHTLPEGARQVYDQAPMFFHDARPHGLAFLVVSAMEHAFCRERGPGFMGHPTTGRLRLG